MVITMVLAKTAMTMGIGMTESLGLVQAGTTGIGLLLQLPFGVGAETITGVDTDMAGIVVDIGMEDTVADTGMVEVITAAAADTAEEVVDIAAAVEVIMAAVAVITVNEQL